MRERSPILVVDAGNTRVKWALHDGARYAREGWRERADLGRLEQDWRDLPAPARVVIANVAGDAAARALAALCAPWNVEPLWVTGSAEQCGVVNLYDDPAQLGPDRWCALIAARGLHDGACLVICTGTATTVDALSAAGEFLGGIIIPGIDLMRESLSVRTARLNGEPGAFAAFPRVTRDAITSGAIQATCGAVERMRSQLLAAGESAPAILACGGSAQTLATRLGQPVQVHDKLILEGARRIAEAIP